MSKRDRQLAAETEAGFLLPMRHAAADQEKCKTDSANERLAEFTPLLEDILKKTYTLHKKDDLLLIYHRLMKASDRREPRTKEVCSLNDIAWLCSLASPFGPHTGTIS